MLPDFTLSPPGSPPMDECRAWFIGVRCGMRIDHDGETSPRRRPFSLRQASVFEMRRTWASNLSSVTRRKGASSLKMCFGDAHPISPRSSPSANLRRRSRPPRATNGLGYRRCVERPQHAQVEHFSYAFLAQKAGRRQRLRQASA